MKTSTTGLSLREARAFRLELLVAVLVGWFGAVAAAAQTLTTYEILHAFRNSGQPNSLIRASDGHLYGTTCWGGTHGVGSVFRVVAPNQISEIHSFGPLGPYPEAPCSTLIQASTGDFYGTSVRGGDNGYGAAFRVDAAGNFVLLHSFTESEGAWPSGPLLESSDGSFYGTASLWWAGLNGVLFQMDSSGSVVVLHTFAGGSEGAKPSGALVQSADGIYGTTFEGGSNQKGTVFKLDSTNTLTTIHSFAGSDGAAPKNGLIRTSAGDLLGTTSGGGANALGTVFKIDALGTFTTLHSFDGTDGAEPVALVVGADGSFYGTTAGGGAYGQGTTFRMTPSGEITTIHSFSGTDGSQPVAQLATGDGVVDGVTRFGGSGGVGIVYEMDQAGNIATVASFENLGEESLGELSRFVQGSDGLLYATSSDGGDHGAGTIFRLDPSGSPAVIHSFVSSEGSGPFSSLTQASDGSLYGAARNGGAHGMGTIFKFAISGTFTVLHSFSGDDGGYPAAAVIQGLDGDFYGTTSGAGQFGAGTVFRMNGSGDVVTLHDFPTPDSEFHDGENPMGSLIQISNGYLYGTTMNGGDSFLGTIFDAVTSGGAATVHSFDSNMGSNPISGLIEGSDGRLYGTTPYVWGTVFRFDPAGGSFETLHVFGYTDENDGHEPHDGVIEGSDGAFYGATFMGGDLQQGTIFRMDSSGNVARVHSFNRFDGSNPLVGVVQAADGNLYGAAFGGPWGGQNIIFRVTSAVVALNQIAPTSGPASGGTTIDVIGGGFIPGSAVTIGGLEGLNVQIPDPTFVYFQTPALSPGTLNDITVTIPGGLAASSTGGIAFFADFLDVPQIDPFHDFVEKIFRAGITAGCGSGSYCPDSSVTRAQMAAFLLKAEHGSSYLPPPCTGAFDDVPCPGLFANWIEQLAREGITAGCGGGNYCPSSPVTRAQMAVFLLKAEHGTGYTPPACQGVFGDVACPSLFAGWIEQLAAEGITSGCGGGNYCPGNPNTRGQMAVFLVKTFHL